jgi:hypothetical protein
MYTRKGFFTSLATVLAITVMIATQVGAVPVTMSPYPVVGGQTRVFRGDLSSLGVGSVYSARVTDAGVLGGQTGVFSGCDIDFVVLDRDGDLSTTADRIVPFQTAATSVTPGSIRNPTTSPYQPTASHPGELFGLNTDGSIDFATATIGTRDASYNPITFLFTVDTSGGWVTLGDSGSLTAAFPDTTIGSSLWLFVGEAGLASEGSTEGLNALVSINNSVPAPGAVLLVGLGGLLVSALRNRKVL